MRILEYYFHSKKHKQLTISSDASFVDPSMGLHLLKNKDFCVQKIEKIDPDPKEVTSYVGIYDGKDPYWVREKDHDWELYNLTEALVDNSIIASHILVEGGMEIIQDQGHWIVNYIDWEDIKESIILILKYHLFHFAEDIVEQLHDDVIHYDIHKLVRITDTKKHDEVLNNLKVK
jgi:hypothetical protein